MLQSVLSMLQAASLPVMEVGGFDFWWRGTSVEGKLEHRVVLFWDSVGSPISFLTVAVLF